MTGIQDYTQAERYFEGENYDLAATRYDDAESFCENAAERFDTNNDAIPTWLLDPLLTSACRAEHYRDAAEYMARACRFWDTNQNEAEQLRADAQAELAADCV